MGWWPWSKEQRTKQRQPGLMQGQNEYVFRRSRTLTGTTSNQVAAGAEARGLLKTDRLKLHQLRQYRVKIIKAVGGAVAVVGLLAYMATTYVINPPLNLAQTSDKQPNLEAYEKSIQAYLATRPLERLGFAMNAKTLQEYLKKQHNELSAVDVDKTWYGGDVRLTISFREPLLTWTTNGERFYVDSQGFAFKYNHSAEPDVAVTDESGISPDVGGGAVASGRFVSFLGRLVGALNGYGKGRVESVTLPASTRQIDIKLHGRSSVIKTHIDRDPLEQAEDIANALAFFDTKEQKPEYIDVRVAHKAFYR